MKEFIPVSEAKNILKAQKISGKPIFLPLENCLGKITASPVLATMDVPSFDNSGMDGYALAWDEEGEGRDSSDGSGGGNSSDHGNSSDSGNGRDGSDGRNGSDGGGSDGDQGNGIN